jgi:two-component system, NtrC family, nitrogen regulation sensor histidine kinase NtrY
MLRRYPYWLLLLTAIVLWGINSYHFRLHRQALLPERMANAVNTDLQSRNEALTHLLANKELINKCYTYSLTDKEARVATAEPFYFFCYEHDSLKFWNTNSLLQGPSDSITGKWSLLRNDNGVFLSSIIHPVPGDTAKKMVVLFPVFVHYPAENDYLHSHFAASPYIPLSTIILPPTIAAGSSYPISIDNKSMTFSLLFNSRDVQKWVPDTVLIVMLVVAMMLSLAWLQLIIIHISRQRSAALGFFLTAGLIAAIRIWLYRSGLPFNLDTLPLFSPGLYASSKYLSSFGDLFINIALFLWLTVFITRHTPYRTFFKGVTNVVLRYAIAIVLAVASFAFFALFLKILRSLILDSGIPFDVSHFSSINTYTILGLSVVGVLTAISSLVLYMANHQFNTLLGNRYVKYALILLSGIVWATFSAPGDHIVWFALIAWVLLFFIFQDIRGMALESDLFQPHMIYWAFFICCFCTFVLHYYNGIKERTNRIAYVENHLSPHPDIEIEYDFDKKAVAISRDNTVQAFFAAPSSAERKAVNQHLESDYLNGALNKYQVRIYLFDIDRRPLYNSDTVNYFSLLNEKNESASTNSSFLFYKESVLDRHFYLSYIPVYADGGNEILGYAFVDLDLKQSVNETVYPELLQPTADQGNASSESEYAYAIYSNDKLITQTKDYPFPINLTDDTLRPQQYAFYSKKGVSELYYKVSEKRTVVMVHYHSELLELIILFSWLFGVQIVLGALVFTYQGYVHYTHRQKDEKLGRLTLKRRVHLSMIIMVAISFVIVGGGTSYLLYDQYKTSNKEKLQTKLQESRQAIQDYLKKRNAYDADFIFDSVSRSQDFKYFLSELANDEKIDINIYDDRGILFSTSQDEIFEKGLLSRMMRPDAYNELSVGGRSIVLEDEQVAGLAYLSAYQPLRDEHGVTLGYINVPFFSSEKDLNVQLSNVVVTLINIYAFIFMLSGLISAILTRWITRSFNVIASQFATINLQKNERITWPYDDEIGLLVREYNKMVNKVEENAAILAQSERETAWREMAQQVAHEIKNPLTPMKLNIQYLQQAMKADNPNIKELTDKVSDSIIEQINNLSYIASEFSNFARMPDARTEEVELGALLHTSLELYQNTDNLRVDTDIADEKMIALADRSQLLRVFTNLLENAKQAIPHESEGLLHVSMHRDDDHAVIAISDNGAGIPEEIARKIFQPYFTTKTSGTGLGLAMTKKIIEFWKGAIWFDTKADKGTTFHIRLPLAKDTHNA